MSDEQTRIDGPAEPLTWDGEPLWSPDTVRESPRLFDTEAFEQMPGQMAMEDGRGYVTAAGSDVTAGFPAADASLPVEPMPSTYRWAL